MTIGDPKREIEIVPTTEPVPEVLPVAEPSPEREPAHQPEPSAPEPVPAAPGGSQRR
jgi:hypothetical protein